MGYIELNNDRTGTFNTPEFLKVQQGIYRKYEVNGISYINNINNYFLHIMEEVWEVKNAPNLEERLGELVDVLMYLGSTVNCFDGVDDKLLYLLRREKLIFSTDYVESDEYKNVNDILVELRREYPERKWHKPYNNEDINHLERSSSTTLALQKAITCVLRSLLADYELDEINKAIEKKQEFILSLT